MLENEEGVVFEDEQARGRSWDEEIELEIGEGEAQDDGVRIEEPFELELGMRTAFDGLN